MLATLPTRSPSWQDGWHGGSRTSWPRAPHDEGMIHMAEYTLPDLDYDYGALDPSISGKIM
ncbi:MAG: hypothetical protein ACTMII_12910, partial [Brachybacterium sp.]